MPLILGTNSIKDTGYNVDNSVRIDSSSTSYLSRTINLTQNSTSQHKFTISCWFKLGKTGQVNGELFGAHGSNDYFAVRVQSSNRIDIISYDNATKGRLTTTQLLRDHSAWYHIVVACDTNNGSGTNRMRLYLNGSEVTNFSTDINPSSGADLIAENMDSFNIGRNVDQVGGAGLFDGYISEFVYIDNDQLEPSYFGEFDEDSGIWKPIDVSEVSQLSNTFSFYLDFKDSSNLGNDVSGNNLDFTSNNLTAIDQTTDTCTNNFATLNPLDNSQGVSFSLAQGNLELNDIGAGDNDHGLRATMGVLSGKWYYEQKQHETSGTVGLVGSDVRLVFDLEITTTAFHRLLGSNGSGSSIVYWSNGTFVNNSALQGWSAGDIIGVALDMDNGKLFFSINGVFKGFDNNSSDPANGTNANFTDIPTDGTGGFAMPYIGKRGTASPQASINFGNPSFSISSGNSDGNGYGNFEYAVPSGYYALNTKNLAKYG